MFDKTLKRSKSMRRSLYHLLIAVTVTIVFESQLWGQTWTQAKAPAVEYVAVACSASGATLIAACKAGPLYISTNSGSIWTPSLPAAADWHSVACSADGSKLFVGAGSLYTSTNYGTTWATNSGFDGYCIGVACSADGTKVAVATGPYLKGVFYSTNSGTTFTSNAVPDDGVTSIACSADGAKLVSTYPSQWTQVESGGGQFPIYRSVDLAMSWSQTQAPQLDWEGLACSADGTIIIASYGVVVLSRDSGSTWTTNLNSNIRTIACSADGTRIAAVQLYGGIFTSLDSGETWTTNDAPVTEWTGIAMSADGSFMVACSDDATSGAGVYTAQIPAQPSLKIAPAASNLQLSWPLPSAGFFLQQSSTLNSTNWVNITNTVTQSGYYNQVTVSPPATGNAYYRLANQ
jgi:photosystem II stability/assembly factor-like uncharacterized protein